MDGPPVIVGILGGIASGKSAVARFLGGFGAKVVDADRIAHEVLESPEVAEQVLRLLGPEARGADGWPDRSRIGRAVFGDPAKLARLEALIHPAVLARIREEIAGAGDVPAVVLDAPLLLEAGLEPLIDVLVFVHAPAPLRAERAARERGWEPDEVGAREARQAPVEGKRRKARHVIENTGTLAELEARAGEMFRTILDESRELRPGDD